MYLSSFIFTSVSHMNFVPVVDWKQKNSKVSHSTQLTPELLSGWKTSFVINLVSFQLHDLKNYRFESPPMECRRELAGKSNGV